MRRESRKQPWQTFPFWFLFLSGVAMIVAWKLDLLQSRPADVANDVEQVEEQLAPDWANTEVEEAESSLASDDQGEPDSPADSPRSFPDGMPTDIVSAPEQAEPASAASDQDLSPAITESPAAVNPFSRTDAKLVSASRTPTQERTTSPKPTPHAGANPAHPQSPFGPAQVEFQGTRQRKPASAPADIAAWSAEEETSGPAAEKIVQTAAIDSPATPDKSTTNPVKSRENPVSKTTTSTLSPSEPLDLTDIDQLIATGEDVEANFQLSNLYWKHPELRKQFLDRLRTVSYRIYFAPQPHYMDGYVVQAGDHLQDVAKDYDVSWEYLAKLNRTDAKQIRPGQKLKVIRGPFAAVVDLSDREMTVHSHGHFVARFDVGIGRDSSSPLGVLKVLEKLRDPTYYGPQGVIEHDDPQNPLGEYWLDLGDSFGIHGTQDESSIGQAESRGCIRMKNRDIADVYDLLTPDSEVQIRR